MIKRILIALGIFLNVSVTLAQNGAESVEIATETSIPVLQTEAVKAYEAKDYERMEKALQRAVELRPFLAHLRFLLAKSMALQDKKTEAFTSLITLQKQGLYFDLAGDEDFANLRGLGVFDYIQQNMDTILQPYGPSDMVLQIPADYALVEALAYDSNSERMFFADARRGAIFTADAEGSVSVFAESTRLAPVFSVFDLEVDTDRGVLWALSTVSSYLEESDPRFAGRTFLLRYDLESGERTGTFRTRESTRLIDMTVSPRDGSIFAVNGATPTIWALPGERLDKETDTMDIVLNLTGLGALRTITIDGDGDTLYFSEYERGLFGHDLRTNRSFTVNMGDQLNTAGIDSMGWHEDSLVFLQNGYEPHRVLRLKLGEEGVLARHVQAIVSSLESFSSPTTMSVVDGRIYLIANSHRNDFDPATGEKLTEEALEPHQVIRASADFGWMPQPESGAETAAPAGS